MKPVGLRPRRPLKSATRVVGADHLLLGEQEHGTCRTDASTNSASDAGHLDLVHERLDVDRLHAVVRRVAMIGTEALKLSTARFLRINRRRLPLIGGAIFFSTSQSMLPSSSVRRLIVLAPSLAFLFAQRSFSGSRCNDEQHECTGKNQLADHFASLP
jgi:hypothetical protein